MMRFFTIFIIIFSVTGTVWSMWLSSELKNEIATLKNTIYYVKERVNIKNKIIGQLENLISSANTI